MGPRVRRYLLGLLRIFDKICSERWHGRWPRLIMIVDCVSGSERVAGLKANDRVDRKHGLAILESVVPGSRAESVLVAEFGTDG